MKYFLYVMFWLLGLSVIGRACDPPFYFLFGEAARERLEGGVPPSERMVLLINLAAFDQDKQAGKSAQLLYNHLDEKTPLLRAYGGALQIIALRDQNWLGKGAIYLSGGMTAFRRKAQQAMDSISQALADDPNNELIRFIRAAIGTEVAPVLPEVDIFRIIYDDLTFLEQSTDSSDMPRMFFVNLLWTKYYLLKAKQGRSVILLEQAKIHLRWAYQQACLPFYKREVFLWSGRLYAFQYGF